jgi:hypothetical protein
MAEAPRQPRKEQPSATTPGRPKDSGSRQQTHPDQGSHSGSPSFDKETTRRSGTPPKPSQ